MSIYTIVLLIVLFADLAENSGNRSAPGDPRRELGFTRKVPGRGGAFLSNLEPIDEETVVDDIDPVTEAAREWILGTSPDQLFVEYNSATANPENLSAIKDTFKLTVYSIMCRTAMKLKNHSNDCPTLWDDKSGIGKKVLSEVYDMTRLIFPNSMKRIDTILKTFIPHKAGVNSSAAVRP